jgi:mRNA interferase RelE/StbE
MAVTPVYQVTVLPAAIKGLRQLHPADRPRIEGAIALLAADPRPPGAVKLKGRDAWRVRVGQYRIIYTIDDGRLLIVVVRAEKRATVYR